MYIINRPLFWATSLQDCLAQDRFSVGANYAYGAIKGLFDGETSLVGSASEFFLPKLDPVGGFGLIILGHEKGGRYGFEYTRYSFPATYKGKKMDNVTVNFFNMTGRYLLPKEGKKSGTLPFIQVFPSFGIELGIFKIRDGHSSQIGIHVSDARYTSIGIPIGGGITINPIQHVSIYACIDYRIAVLSTVREAGSSKDHETFDVKDRVGAGGLEYKIGLAFIVE